MIKIAICDDNVHFTGMVEAFLYQEAKRNKYEIDIQVYDDGDELLKDYYSGEERYDFIFLDIEMERIDGIDTAKQIRDMDKAALIIFVTSHEECAKNLFDFEPVRYLEKPLMQNIMESEDFVSGLRKLFLYACKRAGYMGVTFEYAYNKQAREVVLKDVIYFESDDRIIYIHCIGRKEEYFYGKTLDGIEKDFAEGNRRFLRPDRSYLVNYDYICDVKPTEIYIKDENGTRRSIEISKRRREEFFRQLSQIHHSEGW